MANPTTNYSFAMPTNTDLVKDLPADFEIFGQAVDTQMKTNADAAIAKTIVDAKGDIIAATAADTVSRLAVGSNDTVLTADSSTATGLKWATPAAGGMTLINTGGTTLSGSSVTIGSIPATYVNLFLVIRNYKPSVDDNWVVMRFNSDTNTRYYSAASIVVANQSFADPYIFIASSNDNSVDTGLITSTIFDYANTTTWKMVASEGLTVNPTTTTNFKYARYYGAYNQTGAISSITLLPESGTMTSGTAYLYGVK